MTNIGKVLAVTSTLLSVLFLGFAFAARMGGPNWDAEANALENYSVERTVSEKDTTYTVKHKATQETVKANAKNLPDVIAAAHTHEINELGKKIETLSPQPEPLKARLEEIRKHQAADRKAMDLREQELTDQFKQLVERIQALSVEGNKINQEAQAILNEGELRREDVARLRTQLDELDVDTFQLKEQKKRLQDELSRLKGILDRLQRRNKQLEQAVPAGE